MFLSGFPDLVLRGYEFSRQSYILPCKLTVRGPMALSNYLKTVHRPHIVIPVQAGIQRIKRLSDR